MMLTIIFAIIAIISLTSLFVLLRDIKHITRQMQYKNKTNSHFDLFICSHLTAMRELQSQMRTLYEHINKVEEIAAKKEKEMKTLLSAVSHDIRTPLTSMKGYLKLIEETKDEQERKRYYDIVMERLEKLNAMLDDLFIHAKIADDDYELHKEEMEIYPILCKVIASYYDDFEKKKMEPIIHFSDQHLQVMANQEMVVRMLHNLIHNVLKHGLQYFEIKEEDQKIYFINEVANKEQIEVNRLFERFYQADASRHHDSTGLGLSIVKQIAEIHGWDIQAVLKGNRLMIQIDVSSALGSEH